MTKIDKKVISKIKNVEKYKINVPRLVLILRK